VEITWGWRKPHNDELHDLHISPNITKGGEMGKACGTYGGKEKHIRVFVGKSAVKR
jgi:hypothetical protein